MSTDKRIEGWDASKRFVAEARLIGHIHRNFALLGKAIEGSNRDLC